MRLSLIPVLVAATPALGLECAEGQRAFVHATGETCIPADPQRIVAVRHDAVATPLLDLGAPVVGVGTDTDLRTGEPFIRGAGTILGARIGPEWGLTDVGSANQPDLEAIAALEPDLIILTSYQTDVLEQASTIAPTVVVPDGLPMLDHIALLAEAAGVTGTYDDRLAAYRSRIEAVRDRIGEPSAITVSLLDLTETGAWHYVNWGARDQVLADLGFARPTIQAGQAPDDPTEVSLERLEELGGDLVLSSYVDEFGQSIAELTAQWDGYAPFWRNLPGVETNHFWYPRDVWVGYSFASLDAVVEGMALLAAGRFGE
jgi:iron complex transport system substrate-binding protein